MRAEKNKEKIRRDLVATMTTESLKATLRLLARYLSAFGKVEAIRCYLYHMPDGMYLGLEDIRMGDTDTSAQGSAAPAYDSDLPDFLANVRPTKPGEYILLDNRNIPPYYHMENCQYVIRHELFKTGDTACFLGIITNDVAICDPAVSEWLSQCTDLMGEVLKSTINFPELFSGSNFADSLSYLKVCPSLHNVVWQIERVAPTKANVLIHGETGVGKEVVAESIHQLSAFRSGPFISVNCGSIPIGLADSILFGHEKGAFTGAVNRSTGLFEQAQNGTLFLDEIGELPLDFQVKLLRAIERRTIQRVGGMHTIPINTRIVAATHRNLEEMVEQGTFRADLLYRINCFVISVPPLRERASDILPLLHHFLAQKATEYGFAHIPALDRTEQEKLFHYPWPGNVRELQNVLDRAFIRLLGMPPNSPLRIDMPSAQRNVEIKKGNYHTENNEISFQQVYPLETITNAYIRFIMHRTDGKIYGPNGAAALLHIHPNTLRSRLQKLGIPFSKQAPDEEEHTKSKK